MTDAAARVSDIAMAIPHGEVMTYGQIGQLCDLHPRHVGRLVSLFTGAEPWWRIVAADGLPAACHGGIAHQLLLEEGVPFNGYRVDKAFMAELAQRHRECSTWQHSEQERAGNPEVDQHPHPVTDRGDQRG